MASENRKEVKGTREGRKPQRICSENEANTTAHAYSTFTPPRTEELKLSYKSVWRLKTENRIIQHFAYMFIPGIPGPPKAFSGGLIAPPQFCNDNQGSDYHKTKKQNQRGGGKERRAG